MGAYGEGRSGMLVGRNPGMAITPFSSGCGTGHADRRAARSLDVLT
jgi:hypothetical protein